jgi:hypothetical protein
MNKIIKFHNILLRVTASFKDDSTHVVTERMRASASIDKVVDADLMLAKAQESFCNWNVLNVELINTFVDSTEQL